MISKANNNKNVKLANKSESKEPIEKKVTIELLESNLRLSDRTLFANCVYDLSLAEYRQIKNSKFKLIKE